jgi:hypothetical protein
MPSFVFDRDGVNHPWEQALRELAAGPDERRGAVAENWRMDHRVSRERETEDLLASGCFVAHEGAEEWRGALYTYFKLRLCQATDPGSDPRSAYLYPSNASNLVGGLTPFDRLCHVGSLRAIVSRILDNGAWADAAMDLDRVEDTRLMELRRFHRSRLRSEFGSEALAVWLDRHTEAR